VLCFLPNFYHLIFQCQLISCRCCSFSPAVIFFSRLFTFFTNCYRLIWFICCLKCNVYPVTRNILCIDVTANCLDWIIVSLVSLSPVFKVENQRCGNCTSALGFQTGGFGPWSLCIKFEVWERWISINGGAGTAFLASNGTLTTAYHYLCS